MNKQTYTLKKSYTLTPTGAEKTVWHIMDGDFVVDACDLKRDAKHYCDLWNSILKQSTITQNGVQ
jgi:hypothetical protein